MTLWSFINVTGILAALTLFPVLVRRYTPAEAWAWLAVMILLPWLGIGLFLLLAENPLGRRRKVQYARVLEGVSAPERLAELGTASDEGLAVGRHGGLVRAARSCSALPPTAGNEMVFLSEHDATLDRLISDIDAAEEHVHLVTYIYEDDDTGRAVAQALTRAAGRGVRCRLLADALGAKPLFGELSRSLEQAGVQVCPAMRFNPLRSRLARLDVRNHRKLAVIDGRVGYIGSWNIMSPQRNARRCGPFRDLMARLHGPASRHLQLLFLEDWTLETGEDLDDRDVLPEPAERADDAVITQLVPSGPMYPHQPVRDLTVELLAAARERVMMTTPYLVPDEPIMLAMRLACHRGVEVDLVVPEKSDSRLADAAARAFCRVLVADGVGVHCHRSHLVHTKALTIDGEVGMIGSANYDLRSFQLNLESNLLLYTPSSVEELTRIQRSYLDGAVPYERRWGGRGVLRELPDDMAKLLSPLA